MIIYVALMTACLGFLVLAVVYLADLWEREPLELIQNAFLTGLGTQLVMVLGLHRLLAIESWSGWLYLVTLAALAVVLPTLLAEEKELDERFDGIVYSVAFTAGAASAVHLFNLPGAAARYPEQVVLGSGETPGARDLLLLISSPGPRAELGDLLALLIASVLAGAVLGTLALAGRPLSHRIAGTLAIAVPVGAIDIASGGGWLTRLLLAMAALGTAIALKRSSVFRQHPPRPEREVFLGALKTGLMIFGAIVLALTLIMSLTDRWELVGPAESLLRIAPWETSP